MTCWFLAADQWAPENKAYDDTISLELTDPPRWAGHVLGLL